jgi:DNA-binding transcriptional ArsR family regulator
MEMRVDESQMDIRGNTLRVYVYVLRHGPSELREVQRGLGFSTPSLASYHLSRLLKAGYVTQTEDGKYSAVKDATPELLEGYTKVGVALVPQLFFFSVLFSILVAYFSFKALELPQYTPFLIATSVALVALLWFETLRVWRKLVTWR